MALHFTKEEFEARRHRTCAALAARGKVLLKMNVSAADRDAVDGVIEQLTPLLEPGDLIIDGGNTYFIHTERRSKAALTSANSHAIRRTCPSAG